VRVRLLDVSVCAETWCACVCVCVRACVCVCPRQAFFKRFPHLKEQDLFLTGQSYAGHFVPQVCVPCFPVCLCLVSVSAAFRFL
jgi:hypothetical protein